MLAGAHSRDAVCPSYSLSQILGGMTYRMKIQTQNG